MEPKVLALKLFLDALDVSSEIATVADRKRVQKAVYLGQRSGVDLGYRFSWYIMGPYSPPLARDYYQLAEDIETHAAEIEGKQLRIEARTKLNSFKQLLQVPADVPANQEDWLELLASYDYLRRVSHYSHEEAVELLRRQKSHVVGFVDQAVVALKEQGIFQYK